MRIAEITQKVKYIGVNDRTTHLFESMWPLPMGVTYNSYLVEGEEKVAIVEGVEAAHAIRQLEHVKALLGDGRKPDYLIVNHMEPDHSGGIALLRNAFPDITIVGNAQTISMIQGFYGVGGNTLVIKDGEKLSLGGSTTLSFHLTPMVHWPETMMTYLEEEGVLFSGDAFGCIGTLKGAAVDTKMNTDRYFPEMVRYYSNIVGKYGRFVQRALSKLKDVKVNTICPTHGPVWRQRVDEVISLYDRLSRYEPLDNGATVLYGSMYGNTERMAETAAEALAQAGVKEIEVINSAVTDLSYIIAAVFRHKGLVIAAPTYSDGLFPPIAAAAEAIARREVAGRDVALLGTHTWAHRAVNELRRILENCDLNFVADPVVAKQAPGDDALGLCREAATRLASQLQG